MPMKACIDFLLLCPQKTGSTALTEMLLQHPGIGSCKSSIGTAEPAYWHQCDDHINKKTLRRYNKNFPTGDDMLFEKSTQYLMTHRAANNLKRFAKEHIKFIVVLRNPIYRNESFFQHFGTSNQIYKDEKLYKQFSSTGWLSRLPEDTRNKIRKAQNHMFVEKSWENVFTPEFNNFLKDNSNDIQSHLGMKWRSQGPAYRSEIQWQILTSSYASGVNAWLKNFSRSQFMFVDYEKYRQDNIDTVTSIFEFLSLKNIPITSLKSNQGDNWEKWGLITDEQRRIPDQYRDILRSFYKKSNDYIEHTFDIKLY